MTTRRATTLLVLTLIFLTTPAWSAESIVFSVNLVIDDTAWEASSIGRADYTAPSLCLECPWSGIHRLNGGSASVSWNYPSGNVIYEKKISEFMPTQPACYVGYIEGTGAAGFHDSAQTAQKCAPCVLYVEANGSGSVSGAPNGRSTHNCGTGISLTATPATGWAFVRWGGSIATENPTITFTLDASKSMTAFFEASEGGGGSGGGKDEFEDFECDTGTCPPNTPIVIDVAGGAYRFSSAHNGVPFDIDADGDLERVAWPSEVNELGFLFLDRNGNGIPDDGSELFGDHTPLLNGQMAEHGFDALAELDTNHDGVISELDAVWERLALWRDFDRNGAGGSGEISRLSSLSIAALHLGPKWIGRRDRHGNALRLQAHVSLDSGAARPYYDVYLTTTQ